MKKNRPEPPRPDRIRTISGSFSWIDHRFLRQGFDEGLDRLEKLFYFVLIAVSNRDGVSFYSDPSLAKLLDVRFPHELAGARDQLVACDLIAFEKGIYQVLELPCRPLPPGHYKPRKMNSPDSRPNPQSSSDWKSLRQLLGREGPRKP
jgi:hypothetical protein